MKGMQEVASKVEHALGVKESMNAIDILKRDHRQLESLFRQWEIARSSSKKQEILKQIIKQLSVHTLVEEDLVYPKLEDSSRQQISSRAYEAVEEHHLLKVLLAELADMPVGSPALSAKVNVAQELLQQHVKAEETILLPALRRSDVDLDRLGQQILKRKQALMGDITCGGGVAKKPAVKASRLGANQASSTRPASKRPASKRPASAKTATSSTRSAAARKPANNRRRSAA